MKPLVIDGGPLEVSEVVDVAREGRIVEISPEAIDRMAKARLVVEKAVDSGEVVYGVTTGFGALAGVRVPTEDLEKMQVSLLRSHAAGVGDPLDEEIVRAMMLIRLRTLTAGYSGVRPLVAERLAEMLNAEVHPIVPEQGSVGASGDLAQLAHMALPLIGEGLASFQGEPMPAEVALKSAGLQPITLSFKEGLSLLNGTDGMLAIGCLTLTDAETLALSADLICAMSVEALLGTDRAFEERIHELRPHPGQLASAGNLRRALSGSPIVASHREAHHAVQDAYSVRCAPQVHGAVRDVITYARGVFERELASVTDNPLVFSEHGEVLSAGHFHGEPLGFALDFLAAAASELGSISERRTDRLLDPDHSGGLPPFLTAKAGTNSGFMLVQYTQAALVAENRILSSPATVDTIPTSGSQEDHVSMGWNAALKLRRVLRNVGYILAAESMCAAQGIDMRDPLKPGPGTGAARDAVREVTDFLDEDRQLGSEIERVVDELILSGSLILAAREALGEVE